MEKSFRCNKNEPVVKTEKGWLRGLYFDGVYQFRGIRYAKAKRFQMPEEVERWDGVADATSYGYNCPAHVFPKQIPQDEAILPHRFWVESEHCQYLNVWTNTLDSGAKKAVMVWLHGGGYSDGSAVDLCCYDGANLAKFDDVVLVSLNHRLNVFGHLDMSDFGPEYKNSVNAGMADIVAALRWVRDNIAAFGGDPDNVTVFGQSGGGGKVAALGQIPGADGLYHKAIIMSGVIPDDNMLVHTTVPAKQIVLEILHELGLEEGELEAFLAVPEVILVRAVERACINLTNAGYEIGWGPKKNDWYLGCMQDYGTTPYFGRVPVMVGTTLTEFGRPDGIEEKKRLSVAERENAIRSRFGEEAGEKLLRLFRSAYPKVNEAYAGSVDTFFRMDTLRYVRKKAAQSAAPVYLYLMAAEFDYQGGTAAWHSADIPFVFHNADITPVCHASDAVRELETAFSEAFTSFAKHGVPGSRLLPLWEPCTAEHLKTMVFDRTCELYTDHEEELLTCLQELLPDMKIAFYGKKEEGKAYIY